MSIYKIYRLYIYIYTQKKSSRDFPGGPAVKTPHSQCREPGPRELDPAYHNLKSQHATTKDPTWGSPGDTVVKNPPANAGDTGSSPGPGRSHMPRSN